MWITVKVDRKWCIGCGACVAICPNIFDFDEEKKSYVKNQPENDSDIECVEQAKSACPVDVISIN